MGIFDEALASVRAAELSAEQAASLDQIGAALGTVETLTSERDKAVQERNELLGKYTALLETNMKLALAQTPKQELQQVQQVQQASADPYKDVPKWEITDLFPNHKKEG